MKYTKSAITQLTRWYKQVLIKCAFMNAAVLVGSLALAGSANATTTDIVIDGVGSGDHVYRTGYASSSIERLNVSDNETPASATYSTNHFTDWVQSPSDDAVTVTGGKLITNGLSNNGYLWATGGDIEVQSGRLTIKSGSYINSGANLTLGSGAELYMGTSSSAVTLNAGEII